MFDFNTSIFGTQIKIPPETQVVFVSDMFVEDYVGGAELTSQALIDASPYRVFKLRSRDVSMELLQQGAGLFWVFGNFSQLDPQLIPSIVGNLKYGIVEYDFKYCKYRSPEKHFHAEGTPCDCANQMHGLMTSTFFYGAMGLWWMSDKQKERYHTVFPFLAERPNVVLSSVFAPETLDQIKQLRTSHQVLRTVRHGWIVLGSASWIKGTDDAERWCLDKHLDFEVLRDVSYDVMLKKLAVAKGLVYLPKGGDTCPRLVIEAKLLGCKLQLNDNVMHVNEPWFLGDDLLQIEEHLRQAPAIFWSGIKSMIDYRPTISGYTTTYNALKQEYPFEQCIRSMLQFCDEVCVVDGGSTDETWERLIALAHGSRHIKIKQVPRDWSSPRHPVFDGMQKAEARAMCTSEYCWQMDADEIVHEDDAPKIAGLCRLIPRGVDVLSLPVIEYWCGADKVRLDVQPWKWRLSRNLPHVTHGIPVSMRRTDADGLPYALPGTDGCDMVHKETGEPLPNASFYPVEVENVRRMAMLGDNNARQQYQQWFNQVVENLPCVFHYSWYDMPRKMRLYRDYWQNHWLALWNKDTSDTADNNLMFGIPWKDVTDEMIEQRAVELGKIGGWVWHRRWSGEQTPWLTCNRTQPKVML